VNATLAADRGVRDAGDTAIGAGPSAADLHYVGDDPIRPGETVLIDISPRGPDGYRGDLTRTFVVDGDGGWERRAYLAVESAREAALAEIEPGVPTKTVHGEAAAELAAYGFDPERGEGEAGFTHGAGHGVGVSLHESPSLSGAGELRPGHVVTVEPGVYDPDVGGVRLGTSSSSPKTGTRCWPRVPVRDRAERARVNGERDLTPDRRRRSLLDRGRVLVRRVGCLFGRSTPSTEPALSGPVSTVSGIMSSRSCREAVP